MGRKGEEEDLSSNSDLDFLWGQFNTAAEMQPSFYLFIYLFLLFFIRANKNSRLPTPCNLLLPHLGFWSPSTAHTGQSAAASHSPGTTADSYHPRTPQYVKAEERNLDVSCSKEEEEKIHKATLTGIILSTRMISLSFLGGLRKCETFK